ncbi:unnamed protein product, partial [Rotaria sp. Silwood2]
MSGLESTVTETSEQVVNNV